MESKKSHDVFTPPRHWGYFEALQALEKAGNKGLMRREFLAVMGASMAMAGLSCARKPVHKIIPYVIKPEEITPGNPTWYASTCRECPAGCGLLVKNREGRPIKLEGNPEHPLNKGKLCTRGQASLLNLYDRDRLAQPLKGSRFGGERAIATWEEADSAIGLALKKAVADGRVRVVSGANQGPSSKKLLGEFLGAFSDGKSIEYEPFALDELLEAQELCYGARGEPQYKFEDAEYILSLGADFLSQWLSPVSHAAAWAKNRKLESQNPAQARLSKLVCFESISSVTGANADERHAIRPGDEARVALSIAHTLIVLKKRGEFASNSAIISKLEGYKADVVAKEIGGGLTARNLVDVANELWTHRGRSLVVAGGPDSTSESALDLQIAVNLLNSILENEGKTVVRGSSGTDVTRNLAKLTDEMEAGKVSVLILSGSNPVYSLPAAARFEAAMRKVPVVIALSSHLDETAVSTDWILPLHHYLEDWGDLSIREGFYSLQQPAIAPIHQSRSLEDCLITWARSAGLQTTGLLKAVASDSAQTWYHYLKENWRQNHSGKWEESLQLGIAGQWTDGATARAFRTTAMQAVAVYTKAPETRFRLALYAKPAIGDGRSANNPWLQELPDPMTSVTWDNHLNVSSVTARELEVETNDVVKIRTPWATVEAAVLVQPGLHDESVSLALGYGRNFGSVAKDAGVNAFQLSRIAWGKSVFAGIPVELIKTGRRFELALTQRHHRTEDRPILNDITLAQYRENPAAESHVDPQLRMKEPPTIWPKHEFSKDYRWEMTVDLNSCTGCGACVIACQAENNVPVVGRDRVRTSREMHWVRIDRYFSGSPERPQVAFQPMLCQHCENAPCETVCPVVATVHNSEGLNQMTYNRCVGTRYCQNNCPYKVRRFNFFDHWKDYKDSMNLVWNPDVIVRSRGVMEKCTFCVQRIQGARAEAKAKGRKIQEGDFQAACQQCCPTDAIVFGNSLDPNSQVSKLKKHERGYRVLEVLNVKPSVTYLTKVRNNKEGGEHEQHG